MSESLDDFADLTAWLPVASGDARLELTREDSQGGAAMRLDFDFKGGGGFVVARKVTQRLLPSPFTLSFKIRGSAPPNRLELKLVDASGRNVWWWRREALVPTSEWSSIEIRSREIEFAWGPAGGGAPTELGAIEIAIVAPPGGRGTISIADLRLEDRSRHPVPVVSASRHTRGHEPAAVVDPGAASGWRSGATTGPEWLEVDLGVEREHGGFVIEWEPGREAQDFDLRTSLDRDAWTRVRSVRSASATRSYLFAKGGGDTRYVRLDLLRPSGAEGFGIRSIEIAPFEFSRSIESFFSGIAASEPRGRYPRWLYGEQAYWTPIAAPDGSRRALLNEDGLLEVGRAAFSLEPFLMIDGALLTWAEVEAEGRVELQLAEAWLPIPSVVWRRGDVLLTVTAFATGGADIPMVTVRYRVESSGTRPIPATLYVAIRPFQVDPPWQAFRGMGGVARIEHIVLDDGAVWVNDERVVLPSSPPDHFAAASFDDGAITGHLARSILPAKARVTDSFGYASAALGFDVELAPGAHADRYVSVPLRRIGSADADALSRSRQSFSGESALEDACIRWRERFSTVSLELGSADRAVADAVKTAAAHILTNRYGPALQPGPRRYTRSWIRDGATMSAALLRMGCRDEVRDFIRWYVPEQAADGNVPCCVDERGADWLVEHDSHGQLIFTVMEHYRFTHDRALLEETWPAVAKAAGYIETLRASRCTPEYASEEKRAFHGLLPESVSHEGYLAQPVHSYWDDFWALRGLGDAAEIATALGKGEEARRLAVLAADLGRSLYASIDTVIARKRLAYVPGSVEWADFDPTATAVALGITDAAERLSPGPLHAMFEEYLKGLRARRDGTLDWASYTAYELRIVGALVRLGRRSEANELLEFFLADRRPPPWNQWPEISWRNPRSGAHLGDLPHSWIGAEYVLSVLSMLAYERQADRALVVAAGVPDAWLAEGRPVRVRALPTYYGPLDYTLARESASTLRLTIASELAPPGGIVVRPPLPRPLAEVIIDGRKVMSPDADSVVLARGPAEVIFGF